jgi:hypothetical protein
MSYPPLTFVKLPACSPASSPLRYALAFRLPPPRICSHERLAFLQLVIIFRDGSPLLTRSRDAALPSSPLRSTRVETAASSPARNATQPRPTHGIVLPLPCSGGPLLAEVPFAHVRGALQGRPAQQARARNAVRSGATSLSTRTRHRTTRTRTRTAMATSTAGTRFVLRYRFCRPTPHRSASVLRSSSRARARA